jgi:Zn-dependent protease
MAIQTRRKLNKIAKCEHCGKDVTLPFRCPYCTRHYCPEHRLPENHDCPGYWKARAPRPAPPPIITPESPYEYTVTYGQRPRTRVFWFSPTEIKHLALSTLLVIGVGLSMPLWDPTARGTLLGSPELVLGLAATFTALYLLHELAHKVTAQHYGLWAEFRLTMFGALITLLSIVSPIKLISPGAVVIAGAIDREVAGKTALAGPLMNLGLSIVSVAFALQLPDSIAWYSAVFNAWIALFNLIPLGIMDGSKVFRWNKLIWALAFAASLALTVFTVPRYI